MTVQIPAAARKAIYALAFVAGAVALVVGVFFPDIATTVTERLTTVGGIVSALSGLVAYLHITPNLASGSTATDVQDDMTSSEASDTTAA